MLTELNLGDKCLDGVLSNNNYESDILKVLSSACKALCISLAVLTFPHFPKRIASSFAFTT